MDFVYLWFYFILYARLRLALGEVEGRSALWNPHLRHSNYHFFPTIIFSLIRIHVSQEVSSLTILKYQQQNENELNKKEPILSNRLIYKPLIRITCHHGLQRYLEEPYPPCTQALHHHLLTHKKPCLPSCSC